MNGAETKTKGMRGSSTRRKRRAEYRFAETPRERGIEILGRTLGGANLAADTLEPIWRRLGGGG